MKDLCRRHAASEASHSLWQCKCGGLDVSDARRVRTFEAANTQLKKLLAASMLRTDVTREALRKKC